MLSPKTSASEASIPSKSTAIWTALVAVVLVLLQLELVFSKSINWDEFFHLSQIHASNRGEQVQWLQTPHVFLFSWVPDFVQDSIDQVIAIRLMLLPCALVTAFAIWATAKKFTDPTSAAAAAITWFGAGYVFLHSFALRADMIAAMLLALAICSLATMRSNAIALAAASALSLVAFVATIKSVLYLPAIAAVLVWRFKQLQTKRIFFGAILAFALLVVIAMVLLPSHLTWDIVNLLDSSANRMFTAGLFPNGGYLLAQIAMAPAVTAMVVLAFVNVQKRQASVQWWLPVGLILPLASVAIYRNSYPYFYAFILPPVAILAAWGVSPLIKRYSLAGIWVIVLLGAIIVSLAEDRQMLEKQRSVRAGIAQIFPEPVTYIDDMGFLPANRRAVPHFASGWALEEYRSIGAPIYSRAVQDIGPPMLLRQGYALEQFAGNANDPFALLPTDTDFLSQNYLQHWGRVYVLGKTFDVSKSSKVYSIAASGTYTIEGGPLMIEGLTYQPCETVALTKGPITVGPVQNVGSAVRWGDNLPVPDADFPEDRLFTNY